MIAICLRVHRRLAVMQNELFFQTPTLLMGLVSHRSSILFTSERPFGFPASPQKKAFLNGKKARTKRHIASQYTTNFRTTLQSMIATVLQLPHHVFKQYISFMDLCLNCVKCVAVFPCYQKYRLMSIAFIKMLLRPLLLSARGLRAEVFGSFREYALPLTLITHKRSLNLFYPDPFFSFFFIIE